MAPTLTDRQYILMNKITYKFSSPKRGDIIDYLPSTSYLDSVGRIVGQPGETIHIKKGEVKVNNNVLNEPYADWSNWKGASEKEVSLQQDEYLILNDKRTVLLLSSNGELVTTKRENIIGKFFFRYWPLSTAGLITN